MYYKPSGILIVEDEKPLAELIKGTILRSGWTNRINIIADGEEALEYLFNRGQYTDKTKYYYPVLVILDINLPGINGIKVLKTIKNDRNLKSIPVIMFSTSEREEDIVQSYKHNANSYLVKPVGFKKFEETIRHICFYWMNLNKPPLLS